MRNAPVSPASAASVDSASSDAAAASAAPSDSTASPWLVLLNPAARIVAVDGGAPSTWVGAPVLSCPGLEGDLREAALDLVGEGASAGRHRWLAARDGRPPVYIAVVEGVWFLPEEAPVVDTIHRGLEAVLADVEVLGADVIVEDEASATAFVDQEKLAWCVGALVSNALRQLDTSRAGATVHVHVTRDTTQPLVRIAVECDGLTDAAMPSDLFEHASHRACPVRALALRLVQEIAEAHGGGLVISPRRGGRPERTTLLLPRVLPRASDVAEAA